MVNQQWHESFFWGCEHIFSLEAVVSKLQEVFLGMSHELSSHRVWMKQLQKVSHYWRMHKVCSFGRMLIFTWIRIRICTWILVKPILFLSFFFVGKIHTHTYTMTWFNFVYPHNPLHCQSRPAFIRSRLRSKPFLLCKKSIVSKSVIHCTAGLLQSADESLGNPLEESRWCDRHPIQTAQYYLFN